MPRRPNPIHRTAREWLNRAKGKLALARISLPHGGFREDLCFYAQQAAELAIKAVYVHHGWPFAYIHVLGKLLDGIENEGVQIPPSVQDADALTVYAAETRYPGAYAPVAESEYDEAIRVADAVVQWAENLLDEPNAGSTMG